MKFTFIIPALILTTLLSCANQASEAKENSNKDSSNITTTEFKIINSQDTLTKDGESIQRYENGVIKMQGLIKNGLREGLWKSFYENGSPWSENTFKEGVKNGKTTTWYPNGTKRYEGFYTNDKPSGKWSYWDESGNLAQEKDYSKKP